MKKITLIILCLFGFSNIAFSQTYTTGSMQLFSDEDYNFSAKIDVTSTLVTLTLSGPDGKYLALGFGNPNDLGGTPRGMIVGNDVVIYDGTNLSDRYFGLEGMTPGTNAQGIEPSVDDNQDWTIVSNTIDGETGNREIVATRLPDTGHDGDYVFSAGAASLDLVWSFGFTYTIAYHGGNRGITMQSFTLSTDSVEATPNKFYISPNPAHSRLNLHLTQSIENAYVSVFDVLGKRVYRGEISTLSSSIDVSKWNSGIYLVRVFNDNVTLTKRFVKQ
ncbi:T9SS type A sorting domain-containing protein [Ichthyenterobacterium magnum]|uniref:Putative secreted protein (Por secretion system target) n=1 Tax=Ichthyenterobacterium magnum TaxID=1230530 RepID=A0A420DLC1_9FLAO|nr:T9SS type A sorting domain-containing protein [Ichthyenterobacterium magnum]RKE95000.1 putative secreted protein (Por secretion system target) [Ichthyenterobacterium magnum]